jgi:hypothetical protein
MILFTIAAAVAYGALAVWTDWGATDGAAGEFSADRPAAVWAFVFALPTLVTFVVADAVRLARPKWTLDGRARRRVWAAASGLLAGCLGAVGISVMLAATRDVPAALVFIACPAVSTLAAVAPMKRLRAGWCVACGYDLRAATVRTGTQCPECGRAEG